MEKSMLLAKLRVTSISLALWAVSALVLVVCTRMFWFQDFLFMSDGGFGGLSLVIPIDLVLGPGLMFVIYNPLKPARTKMVDIAIVIAVQLSAAGYGLLQVYEQHPVLISYSGGAFASVRGEMLERQNASALVFSQLSNHEPPLLFAKEPPKSYMPRMMDLTMNKGVGPSAQVELLDGLAAHKKALFNDDPILRDYLKQHLPTQFQQLEHGFAPDSKLAWFEGRYSGAILVFDSNANYLGYVAMPEGLVNPETLVKPGAAKTAAAEPAASAASGAASAPAKS
jgi:hypothetical protein